VRASVWPQSAEAANGGAIDPETVSVRPAGEPRQAFVLHPLAGGIGAALLRISVNRRPCFGVSSCSAIFGSDGSAVAGASCMEARCDDDLSMQSLSFGCKRRQPVRGYHPVGR